MHSGTILPVFRDRQTRFFKMKFVDTKVIERLQSMTEIWTRSTDGMMLASGNRNILRLTCRSVTLSTKSPSSNAGLPQVWLSDITYEIRTIAMFVIFYSQTVMYMQYLLAFMFDLHTEMKSTSSNCLLRIYQTRPKSLKK